MKTKLTLSQFNELLAKGLSPKQHRLEGFAEACYDQNTTAELMDFDETTPDLTDMSNWDITAEEWRGAQAAALEVAMAEFIETQ